MTFTLVLTAGAPAPDLTVGWGTAAPALGLLVVAISAMFATQRTNRKDIKDLRRENNLCSWRQAVLTEVLLAHNISVPSWIYRDPPDDITEMNMYEQQSMARRLVDKTMDPFGGHEADD